MTATTRSGAMLERNHIAGKTGSGAVQWPRSVASSSRTWGAPSPWLGVKKPCSGCECAGRRACFGLTSPAVSTSSERTLPAGPLVCAGAGAERLNVLRVTSLHGRS